MVNSRRIAWKGPRSTFSSRERAGSRSASQSAALDTAACSAASSSADTTCGCANPANGAAFSPCAARCPAAPAAAGSTAGAIDPAESLRRIASRFVFAAASPESSRSSVRAARPCSSSDSILASRSCQPASGRAARQRKLWAALAARPALLLPAARSGGAGPSSARLRRPCTRRNETRTLSDARARLYQCT